MADDTPSGAMPVDASRTERTHNNKTGYDDINTASRNDPDGKKKKVGIQEAIGKTTADVTTEGAVTAKLLDGGKVRVDSGWAKMIADVELKPDVDPDPPHFRIGWVQTLVSSRRTGVYKTAKGETIRKIADTGKASDRREYWDDPSKPRVEVAAPWYDLPEELGTEHRKIHIHAFDKPGFALDPTITDDGPFKGAKLVGVEGAESFLTSLKAGDNGDVTLKTWQWAVPWDVNVDGIVKDKDRAGGAMTHGVSTEANPNLDGPTAVTANHSDVLEAYGSVEAAQQKLAAVGWSTFVGMLPKHEKAAPDSYWNMIGALWKSDAQMRVTVYKGKELVSGDGLSVQFEGDSTYSGNRTGAHGSIFWMLAHMVLNPSHGMMTPVKITVNGVLALTVKSPYNATDGKATVALPGAVWGTNDEEVTVKFSVG